MAWYEKAEQPSKAENQAHANPPDSIRVITMNFDHGFCAALMHELVNLLKPIAHDILVMTGCQIQPADKTHKQHVVEFKADMEYTNIEYNTHGTNADIMVATRTTAEHFPHLSNDIPLTVDHQHHSTVLHLSYLDILVASTSADASQVVQRMNQLRHPNHNRASKHVLLVTQPEWYKHSLPAPYADIDPDRYGYDYPLWHTTSISLFRVLAPPMQLPTTDAKQPPSTEERFAALGMSMELRVLQLPPKPTRHMTPKEWEDLKLSTEQVLLVDFPGKPTVANRHITPAEWRSRDISETQSGVLIDSSKLPTVANRKPTTKPT
jgi:hypothetical protein